MEVGLLLIHAVLGSLIAAHGTQKLFGWFGGSGLERTGGFMDSLGLVPGRRMAARAGIVELAGGVLLAVGLLTPLAAALIGSAMFVAARTAHAGKGPWNSAGGWEYPLVLGTVAVGLAFNGAGAWSLDAALGWDLSGTWWGAGAVLVALLGAGSVLGVAQGRPAVPARATGSPAP